MDGSHLSDANCSGCSSSTSKTSKDDINRSRSISVVHQRIANMSGTTLQHSHCLDSSVHDHLTQKCVTNHLQRNRSKTVSCEIANNIKNDVGLSMNDHCQLNKRKTGQNRSYTQTKLTEADHLNGNILDSITCTDASTVNNINNNNNNNISSRLLNRNRSQTTATRFVSQSQQQSCSKAATNTLIKRGKRTLSSTQIEREKSDEKNVKVIKKNAALRSLSPLLVTSTRSSKKIISTPNTK